MNRLEALTAVVGAFLSLGVSLLNANLDHCMDQPVWIDGDIDTRMSCGRGRYGMDPLVWLQGKRTQNLNIECLKKTVDYTCEDIPEFDFGQNGTLEHLGFNDCPLSFVSIACVKQRLKVGGVRGLTVVHPSGLQLLHEDAERLQGPTSISLEGKGEEVKITKEALVPLSAVERLTLSSMRVRLAPGALAVLEGLKHLDLTSAQLRDHDLSPGVLANLPALTELNLSKNNITNINYDTFQNLTSLEILDVSENLLSSLDGAALAAGCPRLRELDASQNPLVSLRPLEPLQYLEKLKILSCESFELSMSPRALSGLPRLTHVRVGSCYVRVLPADLLAGSRSLLSLDLSSNRLRTLPIGLFSDQHMLQNLDLGWNKLETLPEDLFSSLPELQRLELYSNSLMVLPDRFAEGLTVRELSIGHNPLRCDCHLYDLALRMRESVGEATLPRIDVGNAVCDNPPSLRDRQLADIALHDLACDIPTVEGCRYVQHPLTIAIECTTQFDSLPQQFNKLPLELKLRYSPSSLYWIPSTVQTLDLSDLNMTELPVDLNLSTIKYLNLSGNLLTRVPFELLTANMKLNLASNPLACDCWHAESVRQLQAASASVESYEELACGDGLPVWQVDSQGLCRTTWLVTGSLLMLLILLGLTGMLLLHRSRNFKANDLKLRVDNEDGGVKSGGGKCGGNPLDDVQFIPSVHLPSAAKKLSTDLQTTPLTSPKEVEGSNN